MPLREAGQSPNQIQELRTRGNITTVSSYKGELVNISPADVGISVDAEDDSWSAGVLNAGARLFPNPSFWSARDETPLKETFLKKV